jgi:hypothetical protein
MRNVLGVAMVALVGAACSKPLETVQASQAGGDDYVVPVPPGYALVTDPRAQQIAGAGAVTLAAERQGDLFVASIAIVPIAAPLTALPVDAAACDRESAGVTVYGVTRDSFAMATIGDQTACTYQVTDKQDSQRGARSTVMRGTRRGYSVTCNYDKRDADAPRACDALLAGWQRLP